MLKTDFYRYLANNPCLKVNNMDIKKKVFWYLIIILSLYAILYYGYSTERAHVEGIIYKYNNVKIEKIFEKQYGKWLVEEIINEIPDKVSKYNHIWAKFSGRKTSKLRYTSRSLRYTSPRSVDTIQLLWFFIIAGAFSLILFWDEIKKLFVRISKS